MAQEQPTIKQQADLLFDRYAYYNAAKLYKSVAVKKHPDVKVLERLGLCYRKMNAYKEAENWYAKAVADPKAAVSSHYEYAEVLLRNQEFEKAKAQYALYGSKSKTDMTLKINSCDSAVVWMKNPANYTIKNVSGLNTKYADWGLNSYGKNGLVFTSDRFTDQAEKYSDIYKWTGNTWLKLFLAADSQKVTAALPIIYKEYAISKTDYHAGPMVLNATSDTAYVTISTWVKKGEIPVDKKMYKREEKLYTRRLGLIIVAKKNGKWELVKTFPYNNIKAFSVGHAALAKNGNILYFTSDMPGGFGKTDIWYTEKQSNGSWGKPVNCGPQINTDQEEAFATTGPKGELYFASKGRIGMGGYDIYSIKGEKAQWDKAVNLKYPVNTTSDDFYFTSNDGISGYLSSNREGGAGDDDIYSFTAPPPVVILPKPEPVQPVVVVAEPKPEPLIVGKTYVLKDIYYDFDKYNIRPDAAKVLDKLIVTLKEYPAVEIELSSHTDSRGNFAYNMWLSQRRAESAVAYLVEHGILRSRLKAKGYGETRLLNKCAKGVKCTAAEHQLNRRTEVKALR